MSDTPITDKIIADADATPEARIVFLIKHLANQCKAFERQLAVSHTEQQSSYMAFCKVIDLIESINADRYGKPLITALHLCNDLADEVTRLSTPAPKDDPGGPYRCGECGKLIPVVEAARKTIRENRHLCEATLLDLFNAVQELDAAMDVSAQGRKP